MVLSTQRQYGMSSPQPVSMADIHAYVEYHEIRETEDREDFLYFITQMDLAFIADWRVKNPAGKKPGKGAPQSGNFQA